MSIRDTAIVLATLLLITTGTSSSEGAKPAVSLVLSRASAQRREHDTMFRCDVRLDNATGRDLTVRTNFSSVFDGLELVVTNSEGKVFDQQGYTFHQSPFAPPGRTFTLKRGSTRGTLVFPVGDLSSEVTTLKVRLVGTLPGSDYPHILSTETIEVHVEEWCAEAADRGGHRDLADHQRKRAYADWLAQQNDPRGPFLPRASLP
jgi:hypothetical protein